MKKFLEKIIKKCSSWLGEKVTASIKWLNDELFSWLPKFLKGVGVVGIIKIIYDTLRESYDDVLDKFSFFARLLQIDDVFDSINNAFSPYLSGVLNTDFIGVCNSFGIIAAINEIINVICWSIIIWVFLWIVDKIFKFLSGLAAATVILPK